AFQLGLKTFLREYVGFQTIFAAKDGKEALALIRSQPSIEVVTLDHHMPGMSGMEVLRALGDNLDRPLAVIMITGYAERELESAFYRNGNNRLLTTHFLTKPVQFEKLETIILEAHAQVAAAKRREACAADPDATTGSTSSPFIGDLASKIEAQSIRIADLEREIRNQRGKWRADFWKLAFLALLLWLASQFGLLQMLSPHWEKTKATVKAAFTPPPATGVDATDCSPPSRRPILGRR
ncbi:MAG TPA: response regulator, partial [Bacteroidia bacterium]|nr:response regulator [Bacteroidia bacterium]